MVKRLVLLLGLLLLLISYLYLVHFYWFDDWWNGWFGPPVFESPHGDPDSPIHITLKPQVVNTDQISIDVTVYTIVEIPDLRFRIETSPELKLTDAPQSSFDLQPNQPIHLLVHLTGVPANKAELVVVYAYGTMYTGIGGNGVGFYLEPQNGNWQILSTNEYGRQHPAPIDSNAIPVSPIPSSTPQSSLPALLQQAQLR